MAEVPPNLMSSGAWKPFPTTFTLVPAGAVETRGGIDFVRLDGGSERAVVLGEPVTRDGTAFVEILTGLAAGDKVVAP